MPVFTSTTEPIYWGLAEAGSLIVSEMMEPGGTTVTNPALSLYQDTTENGYLGKVNGLGGTYNPLPEVGEWCEAGAMYSWGTQIVICRQGHFRTAFPPNQTPALFIFYQAGSGVLNWIVGEQVEVGTHRLYNSVEYVCLQAHVTQADWTPPNVPALWAVFVPPSPNWQAGVLYHVNDIVLYNGLSYKCRQQHTSQVGWEPPNVLALWLPL